MRKLLICLAGLALTGCTPNDVTLGGALRHNYTMQTVDPDPQYARTEMEGTSGVHSAAAVERYRKGTVKEATSMTTSETIAGQGSVSGN